MSKTTRKEYTYIIQEYKDNGMFYFYSKNLCHFIIFIKNKLRKFKNQNLDKFIYSKTNKQRKTPCFLYMYNYFYSERLALLYIKQLSFEYHVKCQFGIDIFITQDK